MFRHRILIAVFIAGLFTGLLGAEEPTGPLTLTEAWALTLMHNPRLKVFSLEVRAAEARALQASLRPNPTLDIEAEDFGGSGAMSGFDSAEVSVFISQPLELGGKREKRMKAAAIETQLAGTDYEIVRGEVRAQLTKAFADLLAAQEKTRLYAQTAQLARQGRDAVRQRVEAGRDAPPELARASVELASVEAQRGRAELETQAARRQVAAFWDSREPQFTEAIADSEAVDPPADPETLRRRLALTPQWTRWEKEIERRRAMADEAKAKATPDISVGAGVKRFYESDENALMVGISIPLPLFDRNTGGRQEAQINTAKALEEQRQGQLELLTELDRLAAEMESERIQIESLRTVGLPGAQQVLEASQKAYAEGKSDYLHVLDAQRTLLDVQQDYVESLAAWRKARADLERLTGTEYNTADEAGKE